MIIRITTYSFFFFNDTATTEIYTLSLHDALPISRSPRVSLGVRSGNHDGAARSGRRDERGDGRRGEMARRPLQPTGVRDLQLRHLRRVRRRVPDGRRHG